MTWTITGHPPNYRDHFKSEYSDPHLRVENALIKAGINVVGETPILCEPCGQAGCHHEWKADIRVVDTNILVEVHRIRNKKDVDKQLARKVCLENSGWIVIPVTDKDPPSLAVERVQATLGLAEAA